MAGRVRLTRRAVSDHDSDGGPPCLEGPVRCIVVRDDRVWVAGGRAESWIALFRASTGALRCQLCQGRGVGAHMVESL